MCSSARVNSDPQEDGVRSLERCGELPQLTPVHGDGVWHAYVGKVIDPCPNKEGFKKYIYFFNLHIFRKKKKKKGFYVGEF